jgi:hypothetical protein
MMIGQPCQRMRRVRAAAYNQTQRPTPFCVNEEQRGDSENDLDSTVA